MGSMRIRGSKALGLEGGPPILSFFLNSELENSTHISIKKRCYQALLVAIVVFSHMIS